MTEKEAITIQKYVKGLVQPKTAIKASAFMLWIFFFLVIGFTIWRAYFKPLPTQQQVIKAEKGSVINVQQKQEEKKRAWWIPAPFVDIYAFTESDDRNGVGGRFGAHWEF